MTRQWIGVEPEEMCDNHLLGEHSEHHQELGTLLNHPHGQAIAEGHVSEGQVALFELRNRHIKLVDEMLERGFNHESPLEIPEELKENELWDVDNIDPEYNREDLRERCDDCL